MLRVQQLPLLIVFAQVCREGSITRAAHALGLSKRVGVAKDSSLVARQLADDQEIIAAAPALAEAWARAVEPRELAAAPWIEHASLMTPERQRFRHARGAEQHTALPPPRVVANTT